MECSLLHGTTQSNQRAAARGNQTRTPQPRVEVECQEFFKTGGKEGLVAAAVKGYVRLLGRSSKNNPSFVRGVKSDGYRWPVR